MARPVIVSVEAAIASGKSTLLGLVEKALGMSVYVVQEPVLEWQAISGNPEHNILDNFYKDPNRWSYSFQNYVFMTRVRSVEKAIEHLKKEGRLETTAILVERSYITDKDTFARMLFENGTMSIVEWALYESWWNWLVQKAPQFSGHIYMRTSVDTVMQRLSKRNRGEEAGVSMEYQSQLIEKHEQWVAKEQARNRVPVIIVDANVNFLADRDHLHGICDTITTFFDTLRYASTTATATTATTSPPRTPEASVRAPQICTPLLMLPNAGSELRDKKVKDCSLGARAGGAQSKQTADRMMTRLVDADGIAELKRSKSVERIKKSVDAVEKPFAQSRAERILRRENSCGA